MKKNDFNSTVLGSPQGPWYSFLKRFQQSALIKNLLTQRVSLHSGTWREMPDISPWCTLLFLITPPATHQNGRGNVETQRVSVSCLWMYGNYAADPAALGLQKCILFTVTKTHNFIVLTVPKETIQTSTCLCSCRIPLTISHFVVFFFLFWTSLYFIVKLMSPIIYYPLFTFKSNSFVLAVFVHMAPQCLRNWKRKCAACPGARC